MNATALFHRYQELQEYVGWTDADARQVRVLAHVLEPHLTALIEDFYNEIRRHPQTVRVLTKGDVQIVRLKQTLRRWLHELLHGPYDPQYVARRWQAGWRHVEIGLDQVYTNAALSRLRRGLLRILEEEWPGRDKREELAARRSLNTLLDLDLAIIQDAYQSEYLARWLRSEEQVRLAERQRLTWEKEQSEAAFRTLVEAAPCLILILRQDLSVAYFSPFAEELTGYRREEVLGKNYTTLFLPESDQAATREEIQYVFAGHVSRGYENSIHCKSGSTRCMVWNAQRLDDYQGQPALLAVGQDITQLKQAQELAVQSERLAAIGQMMTGLAHESGNALARSQACLEMLEWEVQDRPEAVGLIGRVQKAQDHLRQLYEEVRNYAAPIRLEREPGDVAAVARQAWQNLALPRQGREAELVIEASKEDLTCRADAFRLEQVFRNIFENALAACKDPVRIVLRCAPTELRGRPALRVSVQDNGPGLTPEQQQRIFDPFFTTKTKGTGLGMAIAKRIMDAHAGQIALGPAKGGGAEILLTLPREMS